MSDYNTLGGEQGVRAVVSTFVERFFTDFIIGFMFEGRDKERIIEQETSLACAHLGGPQRYAGRPLGSTHKPLPINSGHFKRRLAIVQWALAKHEVPADVQERWLAHDRSLEALVTNGTHCVPPSTDQ